jgi:hypothetical protein
VKLRKNLGHFHEIVGADRKSFVNLETGSTLLLVVNSDRDVQIKSLITIHAFFLSISSIWTLSVGRFPGGGSGSMRVRSTSM